MTEDKQSTTNLILIGIVSSIVGGLVVYYLLKKTNKLDPSVQYVNTQFENKLSSIENISQSTQDKSTQSAQTTQSEQTTLYKNNESWEILRDKNGFISKLNVLRDVKLNK